MKEDVMVIRFTEEDAEEIERWRQVPVVTSPKGSNRKTDIIVRCISPFEMYHGFWHSLSILPFYGAATEEPIFPVMPLSGSSCCK